MSDKYLYCTKSLCPNTISLLKIISLLLCALLSYLLSFSISYYLFNFLLSTHFFFHIHTNFPLTCLLLCIFNASSSLSPSSLLLFLLYYSGTLMGRIECYLLSIEVIHEVAKMYTHKEKDHGDFSFNNEKRLSTRNNIKDQEIYYGE